MEAIDILDEACEEEVSCDVIGWLIIEYTSHLIVMFSCTDHPATCFVASC